MRGHSMYIVVYIKYPDGYICSKSHNGQYTR